LGIPSRHLTTFESAHESPVNGKYSHEIIMVYNSEGQLIQRQGSIWNFHSWNDAWFNRPDVIAASGWQAVDATPQEQSEGVMQMGPSPLHSVKNFDDAAPYDTPFVVSEVSAKIHNYQQQCDENGQNCNYNDMGIDTDQHAGTLILTNPYNNVSDITGDYKPLSHIIESRIPKKLKKIRRVTEGDDDVAMFIEATNENGFGEPIRVGSMFFGSGDSDEIVYFDVHCYYMDYNGNLTGEFKNFTDVAYLNAGTNYSWSWTEDINDFLYDSPVETDFFFTLFALVNSTQITMADTASLSLRLPRLAINAPATVRVGVPAAYSVSFYNPLPTTLTNILVKIRTVNMGPDVTLTVANVASKQPMTIRGQQLVPAPFSEGKQSILATLFCDQFDFLEGYAVVEVL